MIMSTMTEFEDLSAEPTVINAINGLEESNRLRHSSNGKDVILRTRIGDMNLSSDEFTFYQLLFKVADTTNAGRLTSTNSHLTTLLNRTGLSINKMDTILSNVNGRSSVERNDIQGLSFNQWLVLCKLIAYAQMKSAESPDFIPVEDALEYIHVSAEPLHVSDFSFGKIQGEKNRSFIDKFECEISGYKVHSDGFQQQHIKFAISTTTTTTPISKILETNNPVPEMKSSPIQSPSNSVITASSTSSSKKNKSKKKSASTIAFVSKPVKPLDQLSVCEPKNGLTKNGFSSSPTLNSWLSKQTVSKFEVVRRFSDFELLASVLHRFYPGVVIPPLPPKSWGFNSVSDTIGVQRSRELQMFLNHLVSHPILKHTYEVKAFLEASSAGFRAYRDLFPRLFALDNSDTLTLVSNPSSNGQTSNMINSIIGMSSTAASLAANGAVSIVSNVSSSFAQTKMFSVVSGILDTVRNVVGTQLNQATSLPAVKDSSNIDQKLNDSIKFEDGICRIASKLEQAITTESKMGQELSQLMYHLKQMADSGNDVRGDEVDIQHTYNCFEKIVNNTQKSLDAEIVTALSPIQYTGRYAESLKAVSNDKEAVAKAIDISSNKDISIRKSLENAKNSNSDATAVLEYELEAVQRSLLLLQKKDRAIKSNLAGELRHLRATSLSALSESTKAFVNSRVDSSKQNLQMLESLRQTLLDSKNWRPEASGVLVLNEFE